MSAQFIEDHVADELEVGSHLYLVEDEISDEDAIQIANRLTPEQQRKPYTYEKLVINHSEQAKRKPNWADHATVEHNTSAKVVQGGYVKPEIVPHADPVPVLFDNEGTKRERSARGQGLFGRNARRAKGRRS